MTLRELFDGIDDLSDERWDILCKLFPRVSGVFLRTLMEWEERWFAEGKTLSVEFTKAQNKVIRGCIDMEVSEIGADVRKATGRSPLTMDTVIA